AGKTVEITSYLDPAEVVRAALESEADAVHPGYGFLAESAELAEAVIEACLTWVGPPPAALRAGGDKLTAKATARAAGVPVLPTGSPDDLGYPLLVKAAAGGGGRGMRIVRSADELDDAAEAARREAAAAFGDDTVFFERYLERAQLRIAQGEEVAADAYLNGHAVEVRLYAEDPRTFLPQAGTIERLRLPAGVRVDAGVAEGDEIGTSYDPMIAKLIAYAPT